MSEIGISSIIIFLALSLSTLMPGYLAMKVGGKSFLPFFSYGVSVWIFLIVGILFYNSRIGEFHSAGIDYVILMLLANIPGFFGFALSSHVNNGNTCRSTRLMKLNYRFVPFLIFILFVIMFGVFGYTVSNGLPPLWHVMFSGNFLSSIGSSSEIYEIRTSSTYAESFGDAKVFFLSLPVLAFIACCMALLQNEVRVKTFMIVLFAVAFVSSAFMHKASLAIYVPAAFFTYIYFRKMTVKLVMYYAVGVVLVLLSGFVFYYSNQTYSTLFQILGFRIFGSYAFNTQFALEIFPDKLEYLEGWSMIKVLGLGGGGGNLPQLIMAFIYGAESGNASLSSFGHWYANFGWFGVVVVIFLITLWLTMLSVLHRYVKNSSILVVIWLYFVVSVMDFARADFFSAIGLKELFGFIVFVSIYFVIRAVATRHASGQSV